MTFNIRKLKIQIHGKKQKLRVCDPRSRDRLRSELKSLEKALEIALHERELHRMAA